MSGQELCFDTVTIANEPQCYSVCCYDPPILDAVEDPTKQWRCVMPRDLSAYEDFVREGLDAVRALQVGNAITHMEGFINASGPAGFIDATLRPAGASVQCSALPTTSILITHGPGLRLMAPSMDHWNGGTLSAPSSARLAPQWKSSTASTPSNTSFKA